MKRRRPARQRAFADGARAIVASLPGVAAWGLVTGIAMVKIGLGWWTSLGMTYVVYSGTSQLTVLPLMAGGTAVVVMLATAAVANLRFVVYSATLSRHLRRVPLPLRLATAFMTIDNTLAALMQRERQRPLVQRVAFLSGANVATWLAWTASSLAGIVLAAVLPFGPEMGYLGVLALFALAVPLLQGRPAWAAALAAGVVAVAGHGWPHRLGTAAAVVAGVAAALWFSRPPRA